MKKLLISIALILGLATPSLAQQIILKGATVYKCQFLMIDSSDGKTGKTGATVTFTINKNGGSFASKHEGTAISEISSGWYLALLDATDTGTDGFIGYHATASGADPSDGFCGQVVEFDPRGATPALSDIENEILDALCSAHTTASTVGNTLCTALTIPRGVAQTNFPIWFKDSTQTGVTGLADANIHCYTQKDGGSFAETVSTTQTEVGRGKYLQPLNATELLGNIIALDCTATSGSNTYHYTTSFTTNH